MKAAQLIDTWFETGHDYNEFVDLVQDITQSTYSFGTLTDDITLLHCLGVNPAKPDNLTFSLSGKKQIVENRYANINLDIATSKVQGVTDEFIDEIVYRSKLMLRLYSEGGGQTFCFASSHLNRDLAARARLGGDAVYTPTALRNRYIMENFVNLPVSASAVIRCNVDEGNRVHKVFALPTSNYTYIPQTMLLDMADALVRELGEFECDHWYIDHFITRVWLTFPEKAKDVCEVYKLPETLVPGVLLETSDTGDCSIRAIAYWKRKGAARIGTYEHEHRGTVEPTKVIDNMQMKLMPRYTELPKRLCELLTIDLPDPAASIERTFSMLNANKILGKKRAENFVKAMTDEVSSLGTMTAYEMAMMFIDLPARYAAEKSLVDSLEEMVGRVPFLDFTKIAKASSSVVLT